MRNYRQAFELVHTNMSFESPTERTLSEQVEDVFEDVKEMLGQVLRLIEFLRVEAELPRRFR